MCYRSIFRQESMFRCELRPQNQSNLWATTKQGPKRSFFFTRCSLFEWIILHYYPSVMHKILQQRRCNASPFRPGCLIGSRSIWCHDGNKTPQSSPPSSSWQLSADSLILWRKTSITRKIKFWSTMRWRSNRFCLRDGNPMKRQPCLRRLMYKTY